MTPLPPTGLILDHLAALEVAGYTVAPVPLEWVRDTAKPGQWVVRVAVVENINSIRVINPLSREGETR